MTTTRDGLRALAEAANASSITEHVCEHDANRYTALAGCMECRWDRKDEVTFERAATPAAVLSLLAALDQAEARCVQMENALRDVEHFARESDECCADLHACGQRAKIALKETR